MKEVSKKTGIIIWTIISVILGIIYAVICKKLNVYYNDLHIQRAIFASVISEFVGLNLIIGLKNLWDFIIKKRYLIALICLVLFTVFGISGSSMGGTGTWLLEQDKDNTISGLYRFIRSDEYAVELPFAIAQKNSGMNNYLNLNGVYETNMNMNIHSPTKSILTLFRIYNIGYLFLSSRMAMAFAWNIKIIGLYLVTYELFMIITEKKKYLSLIATILIASSSFINWWMAIDILFFGELCIIALDKFMLSKTKKFKTVWWAVLTYSFISYIFALYPAWQISFGYIFLALAIWVIIKNRKEYKFEKIDVLYVLGTLLSIYLALSYFYNMATDAITSILNSSYPGARNETGGRGLRYLFSYLYSFMLPYLSDISTMEYASFLSVFPVPIIIAMVYLYKKEKNAEFILPILIVLVLETVWCISGFPGFLSKLTLFNKVPVERCAVAIELGSIYLCFYMLSVVNEKVIKQTTAIYIMLGIIVLICLSPLPESLDTRLYLNLFAVVGTLLGFLLLNIGNKKYEKIFLFFAIFLTLFSGVLVNPVTYGIGTITNTNFAKTVQAEALKNPEEIWITDNMDMVVSNYLVAQGAKSLNATQIYPNDSFWKNILKDKTDENKDIWNRYSHIRIALTDEDTDISLINNNKILLKLNKQELSNLNIKYVVSYRDDLDSKFGLQKIYTKTTNRILNLDKQEVSGIYIYKFVN